MLDEWEVPLYELLPSLFHLHMWGLGRWDPQLKKKIVGLFLDLFIFFIDVEL